MLRSVGVHGGVRLLFRLVSVLAVLMVLLTALVAWRLKQGPVSLAPLTPYVEAALTVEGAPFSVSLGDSALRWQGRGSPVSIWLEDVRAVAPSGVVLARVPHLAVTLAPWALLNGQLHVRTVDVWQPHVQVTRSPEDHWQLGVEPVAAAAGAAAPLAPPVAEEASATPVLAEMLAGLAGQRSGPLAELRRVRFLQANADIADQKLGVVWDIPQLDMAFERIGGSQPKIRFTVGGDVAANRFVPDGLRLSVQGDGWPGAAGELVVAVDGLRPAALAGLAEDFAPLAGADLPLAAEARLAFTLPPTEGELPQVMAAELTVVGGEGNLTLPPSLGAAYHLRSLSMTVAAQAQDTSAAQAQDTSAAQAQDKGALKGSLLDLRRGEDRGVAALSATVDLKLVPPTAVAAEPEARIGVTAGLARQADGTFAGELVATTHQVLVNSLAAWWPTSVAPNPREWVTGHLRDGVAREGRWALSLRGPTLEQVEPVALDGTLAAEGVTVDYLPPMPAATGTAADVHFALDRLDIKILDGFIQQGAQASSRLTVQEGAVALTGLDQETQYTDIRLKIAGPVADALRLIDNKPLGYATKLGVKPARASGRALVDLHMSFPTLADLKLDQIGVEASAAIQDAVLGGGVFGQDLTAGNLTLNVNTRSLEARGQAVVGGIPATFTWSEVFSGKPYRSRYLVKASVAEDRRGVFGLTFAPFTPTFIKGPVETSLDLTIGSNGQTTILTEADLSASEMFLPGYHWRKEAGRPATALATVLLTNGKVREVPTFTVRADGGPQQGFLTLEGAVQLDRDSNLQKIVLKKAEIGNSNFSGQMTRRGANAFAVEVQGSSLDLVPFLNSGKAKDGQKPAEPVREELPPLFITARFDTVWTDEDGLLNSVQAKGERVNGRWMNADLRAMVDGSTPFTYHLAAAGADPLLRTFRAETADAGGLLRALGLWKTMQGGALTASGRVDASGTSRGMLGIQNYRLVQAPLLARLLSVAALTGIVDALTGEGIAFDTLQLPFTLDDHQVVMHDFRTHGNSLGLTGKGRIFLDNSTLDIGGTIVPAYFVNSLLGNIPLIGGLLTGFTDGGGIIAATYTVRGTTENPDMAVNPLSTLAPGLLKAIFGAGAPDQSVPVQSEGE